MKWLKEAITDGEIDALHRAAVAACNEDTRYPDWRGRTTHAEGHCYVMARWLCHRLGGAVGRKCGHYVWLSPDHSYYIDLTGEHTGSWVYAANTAYQPTEVLDNDRTQRFTKRANRIFESLDKILRLSLDYSGDAYPAQEPQREDDRERFNDSWNDPDNYWHDEPDATTPEGIYQFVYCNPGEAPIWMADLSFKPIADVAVGDEVVGWDFNGSSGNARRRRLTTATVTALHRRTASVVRVTFASGRSLRCTADHRWLNYKNSKSAVPGDVERFTEPKVGKTLVHVIDPTPELRSDLVRTAAWLGGIFDGEGSAGGTNAVSISQCPIANGDIHERIEGSLAALGLPHSTHAKDTWLTGGRQNEVNFANWTNPSKRSRIASSVLGERWRHADKIVTVEADGEATVYGLTTSTGNYVAWGYASKNCNGQLEVSPNHSHDQLAEHTGIRPTEHTGPFAAGHVVVSTGRATWEVQANVNLHSFLRILKDATKNYGWRWGGMTDTEGQPINDMFGPSKSATVLHYAYVNEHLFIGRIPTTLLALSADTTESRPLTGTLRVSGQTATLDPHSGGVEVLPALFEWAGDNGLKLYAGNDNVIKTIPDLQLHNDYDPAGDWNPAEPSQPDERLPTGLYRCPACDQLFPNWHEYQQHRREQESWGDPDRSSPNSDYGLPDGDKDPVYGDGAHFTEQRWEPGVGTVGKVVVLPARSWKEAARVDGFARYAKAFNYDNDSHNLYVAYHNGDPVGYVAVRPDGGVTMMHTLYEGQGIGSALYNKLTKHYDALYTNAAHEKTASILTHWGWLQVSAARWKWSKGQAPKDMLESPIPFIYDVDNDKIFAGSPGARTSDIPGRFTPGGIVEGMYDPGGKVTIRTITTVPYTVRHLIELWYYTYPQLEVKSVHLMDDAGKNTRLARTGATIKQLVAMEPAVYTAAQALLRAGADVYVVGGAVRDTILGKDPADFDLMVTKLPSEKVAQTLKALPGKTVHVGKSFGIFEYRHKGAAVQIALPRREHSTGAGHTDFDVKTDHAMDPQEDLARRDFTANAIAVSLRDASVLDPHHGVQDIADHKLRVLGPHSFEDDPLRVLRALSALSRHGLVPDTETATQMREAAHTLAHLPAERIAQELDKILAGDNPHKAIRLAHETNVLAQVLPEVAACFGYDQNNPHHHKELGEHLLATLAHVSTRTSDKDLRLAALLHDIGKPSSAWLDPETNSNHFYAHYVRDEDGKTTGEVLGANHEEAGADMTQALMTRLRYPNSRITRVTTLVANHMFAGFTTVAGARRFLAKVGDHADDLFTLRWADQGGKDLKHSSGESAWDVDRNRQLVNRVREANEAFSLKDLAINGRDLIAAGVEPGPAFGKILSSLMEKVIADPDLNERATLLKMAND